MNLCCGTQQEKYARNIPVFGNMCIAYDSLRQKNLFKEYTLSLRLVYAFATLIKENI